MHAMASNAVRGFEVEDTAVISLRFASGALGSLTLSDTAASPRSWEQTSGENPDFPRHPEEDCCFITGTQGSLALPELSARCRMRPSPLGHHDVAVGDCGAESQEVGHVIPLPLLLTVLMLHMP